MNTATMPVEWLLEGPAWVQYRTHLDLLGQSNRDEQVAGLQKTIAEEPQIQALLGEVSGWPGGPIKRHNDASHLLHKLTFLADIGIPEDHPVIRHVLDNILEHQSAVGPFQVLVNIPVHFGGSGQDEWRWMLCDAPTLLYILFKLGWEQDGRVQAATKYLTTLIRENGWPCAAASAPGSFRGPGRKEDPCPYANLVMLKALAQSPAWREQEVCRVGAESLLSLWEQRTARRPYLFAMGSDFAKLKAPLIWFDLLHLLDILSQFPWLRQDARLQEMAGLLAGKADAQGRFTPESIWTAWKGWDFGQKKEPSRWLTLVAQRALKRMETA